MPPHFSRVYALSSLRVQVADPASKSMVPKQIVDHVFNEWRYFRPPPGIRGFTDQSTRDWPGIDQVDLSIVEVASTSILANQGLLLLNTSASVFTNPGLGKTPILTSTRGMFEFDSIHFTICRSRRSVTGTVAQRNNPWLAMMHARKEDLCLLNIKR